MSDMDTRFSSARGEEGGKQEISKALQEDKELPYVPSGALVVIILGALSAFGPLSMDMYLPSLPALAHDFSASTSQVQITLSTCLLGLASGQLIAGPLSDAAGRRRPLLIGVALYAAASLLCVVAPSVFTLAVLRFVQGLAGAAGIVISRAVVRDLYSGVAAARFFSLLMLVNGLAPILAPIIGSQLLRFTSWRGVFVTLAIIGVILFLLSAFGLKETHSVERRQTGGLAATFSAFRVLCSDRLFIGYALAGGLSFAAMFAYISGSSFVLQDIYGVSPQLFGVLFGINALGIVVAGQVNGRLVGRVSARGLLTCGLSSVAFGGLALLLMAVSGVGLVGILPAFFIIVASQGLVMPNSAALGLADHPRIAGSASALLGMLQYAIGALVAPLVGLGGGKTALPMSLVIAFCGVASLGVFLLLCRTRQRLA